MDVQRRLCIVERPIIKTPSTRSRVSSSKPVSRARNGPTRMVRDEDGKLHWQMVGEKTWIGDRAECRPTTRVSLLPRLARIVPGPTRILAMTVAHISVWEIRHGGHEEEVSARDRRRLPQIVRHCQLLAYGPLISTFSLDLVYPSFTELSSGFRIDVEQLNIYLSRCSSSLPFTNLVSFPMHRSRNTVLFLHLFPGIDGRCSTLNIQASKLFTFFSFRL